MGVYRVWGSLFYFLGYGISHIYVEGSFSLPRVVWAELRGA